MEIAREARSRKCNQIYSSFLAKKGLERSSSWLIASMLESREGAFVLEDGKTMENFSSSARTRVPRVPRLLRNPIEISRSRPSIIVLARAIFYYIRAKLRKVPRAGSILNEHELPRDEEKSLRNFPFRIIDYTACNYFEPFDYHSRISTSEDQSVWKNRWGWIEASQHVLYPSSPISIRSIE